MTAFAFCQKNFYIAPKMQPATGMFPPQISEGPSNGPGWRQESVA